MCFLAYSAYGSFWIDGSLGSGSGVVFGADEVEERGTTEGRSSLAIVEFSDLAYSLVFLARALRLCVAVLP